MPEKNEQSEKATNSKKQKCTIHAYTHTAECPFLWGAYVARTTPAGAQIETGGMRVGRNDVRRGAAGDGHGDCELW